jgi:antitoxin component of MazEF toxin-antitoxin module
MNWCQSTFSSTSYRWIRVSPKHRNQSFSLDKQVQRQKCERQKQELTDRQSNKEYWEVVSKF